MREDMQHRLGLPPSLVVIKNVFGETAGVQNPEVRTDTRPGIRAWLAAIIEACPIKSAREERAFGEDFPPAFSGGCVAGMVQVVGADVSLFLIGNVNPAGEEFAAHL